MLFLPKGKDVYSVSRGRYVVAQILTLIRNLVEKLFLQNFCRIF